MPHTTFHLNKEAGPVIPVKVDLSDPLKEIVTSLGKPVIKPMPIMALIDTGASISMIDKKIITKLGILSTGEIEVITPSSGVTPHKTKTYDVGLTLMHPILSTHWKIFRVAEADLSCQNIQMLIGRDVLASCYLAYDGSANIFVLAF